MKKLIVLTLALLASASTFAFQAGMSVKDIGAEVAQRVNAGETTEAIAAAAKKAGVDASVVQTALLANGKPSQAVFTAMVDAGFDVAVLAPPTAAGGQQAAQGGGTGFNGSGSFGATRAGTVSGGGSRSVSGS